MERVIEVRFTLSPGRSAWMDHCIRRRISLLSWLLACDGAVSSHHCIAIKGAELVKLIRCDPN